MQIYRDIQTPKGRIHKHVRYDSFAEAIDHIESKKVRVQTDLQIQNKRFAETANLAEANKLAQIGWKEGLEKASSILSVIEPRIFSFVKKKVLQYHYAGGVPDIGVFMGNDPECFLGNAYVEEVGPGKLARVVLQSFISAAFSAEQVMMRGIAIIAVVDAMEKAGRSCEVVAISSSANSRIRSQQYEIEIPLKKQGEVLDIEKLSYALGHPSFVRRHMFSLYDVNFDSHDPSYGYPCDIKLDEGDLYFTNLDFRNVSNNNEQLVFWVMEMLKSQGIELEDA